MTTTELIYKKAQTLDDFRLQELNDFLDFLLQKKPKHNKEAVFPVTKLESFDANSPYSGNPLSLEDMDNAVSFEAGQHK